MHQSTTFCCKLLTRRHQILWNCYQHDINRFISSNILAHFSHDKRLPLGPVTIPAHTIAVNVVTPTMLIYVQLESVMVTHVPLRDTVQLPCKTESPFLGKTLSVPGLKERLNWILSNMGKLTYLPPIIFHSSIRFPFHWCSWNSHIVGTDLHFIIYYHAK